MAVNSYGAVITHDFGAPKIVSITAKDVISGGQAVLFSGADIVSSGTDSYTGPTEHYGEAGGTATTFGGIAMQDIGSNTVGPVLVGNAVVIVEASGAIAVNAGVVPSATDYYVAVGSENNGTIGRAISSASAKDKWFLLNLNP